MNLIELEKLAVAAGELRLTFQGQDDDAAVAYICACDPRTIQQLIALVRLQHSYLLSIAFEDETDADLVAALAAYEQMNGGE